LGHIDFHGGHLLSQGRRKIFWFQAIKCTGTPYSKDLMVRPLLRWFHTIVPSWVT
jgi:hypothetical protein